MMQSLEEPVSMREYGQPVCGGWEMIGVEEEGEWQSR